MSTIIRAFIPEIDWPYIKAHACPVMCFDTCGITACDSETGEIYGMVVYDSFSPNAGHSNIAITHPIHALRAGLLETAADYFYNVRGRNVMLALTAENNTHAQRFHKHIGLTEVTRLRDGFKVGEDHIIYEMRREDCRWLDKPCKQLKEVNYGQ